MTETYSLSIGKDLTIQNLGELYMNCLKQLSEDHPITVDISEVCLVDTAGVQFLLSLYQHSKRLDQEIVFSSGSESLIACVLLLGLHDKLKFLTDTNNIL